MQFRHLALAAGILLISAGAASAAPALVTGDLNLRSGPGTNFGVLAVLPGGATVNVVGCADGWCRIAWRGGYGYASSRYLDAGGTVYAAPPPPVYAPPPVFSFGFGFGSGWHRDWGHDRHRDWDGDRHHDRDHHHRH